MVITRAVNTITEGLLFRRVILMSTLTTWATPDHPSLPVFASHTSCFSHRTRNLHFSNLSHLHSTPSNTSKSQHDVLVSCLKRLSVAFLLSASRNFKTCPLFAPSSPILLETSQIDLMVGFNSNDAKKFFPNSSISLHYK